MISIDKKGGILIILFCSILLTGCAENKILIKKKVQALEDLGNTLIYQGNLREGLEKLIEASKLDPESANIHNELGLAYRDLREFEKSGVHFKKALALKSDFSEAQNNLGTLYLLLKKWDLAIGCFQKAVGNILYKTPHFAYNNMGLAYYNKGNYQNAIENYQKALKSFPSYSLCYENLALAHEALNSFPEAIEAYKKSIFLDPDYPTPHFNLARLYIKLNRNTEAIEELKQTIKIDREGPFADEAKKLLKKIK